MRVNAADHINIIKIIQRPFSSPEEACSREKSGGKLLRDFCIGVIFDFFNRIDPKPTCASNVLCADPSGALRQCFRTERIHRGRQAAGSGTDPRSAVSPSRTVGLYRYDC